jgi:group II intron reverse transcriptase/maturase
MVAPDGTNKTISRIEALHKLNSQKEWTNKDLYRLMFKEDLYLLAYEKIKSKPGNMTPGTDGKTLDGTSLRIIRQLIEEMKTETFQFKPVKTVYIPKENGKMRKLGVPSTRDKIVQEVMRTILEAIYDSTEGAYFSEHSHGFRRGHSTHTALKEIREGWTATNWFIEGDISACFDEVNHEILVNIVREKIKDERFLNLIWKLLRAGEFDMQKGNENSLAGTPQGGVVSPILANIYLNKLDEYIKEIKEEMEKGEGKARNPEYRAIAQKRTKLAKEGKTKTKEFEQLTKLMKTLPSVKVDDPEFIRIRYTRYADDWMIGICGSKETASIVKEKVREFLNNQLHLRLSEEKTKITNARTEEASFLGYQIRIGRTAEGPAKQKVSTNNSGINYKRRSTGWEVILKVPVDRIIKRLSKRGYCKPNGEPTPRMAWQYLDRDQIILLYSSVNRGIQEYYRPTDNFAKLNRIQYILEYSLAKTLAMKMRKSVPQVMKEGLKVQVKTNKGEKTVAFYKNSDWKIKKDSFKEGKPEIDLVRIAVRLRTNSKLGMPCCICGSEYDIVMHHVRHIRKMDTAGKDMGFARVLRALNRKQIPVCESCHKRIHRGDYDGMRLSDLKYDPRKANVKRKDD